MYALITVKRKRLAGGGGGGGGLGQAESSHADFKHSYIFNIEASVIVHATCLFHGNILKAPFSNFVVHLYVFLAFFHWFYYVESIFSVSEPLKKSRMTSSSPFADVKGNILGRTAYRPSFIVTASMLRRNLQNLCPPPSPSPSTLHLPLPPQVRERKFVSVWEDFWFRD